MEEGDEVLGFEREIYWLSVRLGIIYCSGHRLGTATGFRAFLPMLIVSGAAYAGHLQLDNSFAWLGTPSALTMLSVAAFAEILAYYVPIVDNLLVRQMRGNSIIQHALRSRT